ncbi:hypothetical protein GCM10007422_11450 [Pedobacter zeae]|uniref:Uncharacterized protein n=1 Tax=Pedobacter zeae TaxID=1737356 RepID=A0ABQ1XPA8_9SPHI|nr:hypothetical protein GCM10007422_11450 [Pedobacter zeae]
MFRWFIVDRQMVIVGLLINAIFNWHFEVTNEPMASELMNYPPKKKLASPCETSFFDPYNFLLCSAVS